MNDKNYKCNNCNIEYTNKNEYYFHINVDCPKITKTIYYMTEVLCLPSKKYRSCYRCGRLGHYYEEKECYATKDIDGYDITWGTKQSSSKKYKNHKNKNM